MTTQDRACGLIVHIDPNTNDVHGMTHGRRSDSVIGMLKEDENGRHYVHIQSDHLRLAADPRLINGKITKKGPYLLLPILLSP